MVPTCPYHVLHLNNLTTSPMVSEGTWKHMANIAAQPHAIFTNAVHLHGQGFSPLHHLHSAALPCLPACLHCLPAALCSTLTWRRGAALRQPPTGAWPHCLPARCWSEGEKLPSALLSAPENPLRTVYTWTALWKWSASAHRRTELLRPVPFFPNSYLNVTESRPNPGFLSLTYRRLLLKFLFIKKIVI